MSEFENLNLEELAQEEQRLNEGGGGNFLNQFVPMPEVKPGQKGSVAVRLLPPTKGTKLFQYNRTHKLNGRSIHCPRPLVNGKWDRNTPCPICENYSSIWKQIEKSEKAKGKDNPEAKALKEKAKELKPVERYYYNAIVRTLNVDGKEEKNVGPRILSVGVQLHKVIITAIFGDGTDPESKLGNVTDLKNGWDFIIRKEVTLGGDGFPKYDGSGFARATSPAGTADEIKRWAANLHDLTKLRNPRDVDYLERELAIHKGLIKDEADAFDTAAFDAKWGAMEEDSESGATSVNVPVTLETATETVTEAEEAAPAPTPAPSAKKGKKSEPVAVEDEEFLAELNAMEG